MLVEACACALHDIDEEPCDVSAVVGLLLDDVGELLGGGIHGGGVQGGGWVPAFAGTTVVVAGTTGGVVFGEGARHFGVDDGELTRGLHAVAGFEVGHLTHDGADEELGDEVCALGVLSDHAGEFGARVELDEPVGRLEAVVGLEVGQVAEHGLCEEVDDEPSALGLLVDDVGE